MRKEFNQQVLLKCKALSKEIGKIRINYVTKEKNEKQFN